MPFFCNETATTEIYTLSLHDALPIWKIARKEAVPALVEALRDQDAGVRRNAAWALGMIGEDAVGPDRSPLASLLFDPDPGDRKSTRLNSSHQIISYAVFCLKKKKH